jgi:hypothetical protein
MGGDLLTQAEQGPCEWCLTFSGRMKKGRVCCELRMLAAMPKARRQEVYNQTLKDDGVEAMKKQQQDVATEYRRLVEFRAAKHEALSAPAKAALLRP